MDITKLIVEEFDTAQKQRELEHLDFDSSLDMLECKRTEKDYDWMSDVFLPELPSIILTDASGWANQYFQTRDFVEAKLEGTSEDSQVKAKAASRCINQTLNRRELYHYHKYIRTRTINALSGQAYILCEWKQELQDVQVGTRAKDVPQDTDVYGNPFLDEINQLRAFKRVEEPIMETQPVVDCFNYEVIDPRNVATDSRYCYSIQQKDWITIRYESSYEELKKHEEQLGLFNLDELKENKNVNTKSAKAEAGKDSKSSTFQDTPTKHLDVYLRMGKLRAKVTKRNEMGHPVAATPDDEGELIDVFAAVASDGMKDVLIRFQPNPYRDSRGRSYRPIVRGWCYIHPTKDTGLSDGKYGRELQIALNDTLNMSIDRTKLATLPTFIGRRMALDDTTEFFIEPEHVVLVDDPQNDLRELKISDNTTGALEQIQMLKGFTEQVMSVYPTTMGQLPSAASTTATAVAGAESRTNLRSNYKSLTFEYTFFAEFYWMILQMTHQFAMPHTKLAMLGDLAMALDPNEDYTYSPVSSNIETEYNKYKKLQLIDQFIGRVSGIENPKTPRLINYLLSMAFGLFDKEFPDYKKYLLDENAQQPATDQVKDMRGTPMSNQSGQPMSMAEQFTRSNAPLNTGGIY